MNILVVCHYGLYEEFSSSFVHAQAKAYAQLGHHVHVLIPIALGKSREQHRVFPLYQNRLADGVHLHYIRFLSLSNYGKKYFNTVSARQAIQIHCKSLFQRFVPDVIHAHTLGFDSDLGSLLKQKLNCPLVVTTHGSDTSVPYMRGEKAWLKACCDKADAVVGVSSKLVQELTDCKTQTRLQSILNGFAVNHLANEKKIPDSWIQVGHLIPQKCQEITIRAFAAHLASAPQGRLTIIGEGPDRNRLEALCKELGISHAVRFTGQLPNREALAEMASAQFFVMPSHPEGFGIVYLEAMASGCITLGTQGEGIADLIVNGENGFLVPPDDSHSIASVVMQCLENPELAKKIAEEGKKTAVGLTWGVNVQKYINVFKELGSNANIAD